MRKLGICMTAVGTLVFALGLAAPALAFNCPGSGVACGYAGYNYSGTTLFNKSTTPPGAEWNFTDDVMSSVNNDTTGARLCLYEEDIFNWPWIGVPAGVGWADLRDQGVDNVADYVHVNLNSQACE